MSDFRMVSPLLDGYTLEKTVMTQRDRTWYSVRHIDSGDNFVLKHISVPASDAQVRALILSGIYKDENDVMAYYTGVVSDIKKELDAGKKLAQTGCFAGAVDYQIEQKTDGIGYDVYILQELQVPLNELIARNGMTHLRAINLGIDICDAIIACREAGYLFVNLKPENIFLVPSGKFLLGDLGLIPMQDLQYAGIPEAYIDSFSPPELFDIATPPNTTIDLYSLGMVLYRIYNGNHGPFEDENTNGQMADRLRLSGKPLPTPIYADYEMAAIITKACAFRIGSRYSSPERLKEALVRYLQRNQIPDSLIVPPLIVDPEPVIDEELDVQKEEPLRMVDAEELDAAFKASFTPNTENAGTDKVELSLEGFDEEKSTEEPVPSLNDLSMDLMEESADNVSDPRVSLGSVLDSLDSEYRLNIVSEQPTVEEVFENFSVDEPTSAAKPIDTKLFLSDELDTVTEVHEPGTASEPTEDPLTANTVSGPKMPTGPLKRKKKNRSSRHRDNLVVEVPLEPTDLPEGGTEELWPTAEENTAPESHATTHTAVIPDEPEAASVSEPGNMVESNADTQLTIVESKSLSDEIDELIASVNEVVGYSDDGESADTLSEEAEATLASEEDQEEQGMSQDDMPEGITEQPKKKEKKKSKWLPLTVIAILTVALVGVIAFLLNSYYVNITSLELVDHSTEEFTVELITPDAQEDFVVICTDNYGNTYRRIIDGNRYTFTGLRENTAYTVTVTASEYHRLRSGKSYTTTIKTPGTTKITEFTAHRGTQAGEIVLNLSTEGPSPEEWLYTYSDNTGVVCGPFPFVNQTASVSNMKEGLTYTFSVEATGDVYLSGNTTVEYTLYPIVTVHNLHITDVVSNSVSIAWDYKDNAPEEWIVTCSGVDFTRSLTTGDLNVTFTDLPGFTQDYTFTVAALGVEEPATLTLSANPIILEEFKAEYKEDGTVVVSWNTPAGAPEHGWHLTYNTVGSFHVPYFVRDITTNSVTLDNLIPNAKYQFNLYLTSEEASSPLFGSTSTTLETPKAEAFRGYNINPTPVYGKQAPNVSLWLCPEEEDWAYTDLRNLRTSFTKDERIAICVQVESVSASEDTVELLYVLRDKDGLVVVDESGEFTWDSLWFERRHANEIPLPMKEGETTATPGTYTIEVYINGMLLTEKSFVIA